MGYDPRVYKPDEVIDVGNCIYNLGMSFDDYLKENGNKIELLKGDEKYETLFREEERYKSLRDQSAKALRDFEKRIELFEEGSSERCYLEAFRTYAVTYATGKENRKGEYRSDVRRYENDSGRRHERLNNGIITKLSNVLEVTGGALAGYIIAPYVASKLGIADETTIGELTTLAAIGTAGTVLGLGNVYKTLRNTRIDKMLDRKKVKALRKYGKSIEGEAEMAISKTTRKFTDLLDELYVEDEGVRRSIDNMKSNY
ncbi:MAG: hypothetical protein JW789_03380 [Candidatus Aenigmarchaeota archaeon]|nr:hypothetical protein [Candidatus Aenigmarchaeota archaeon]